jgi:hypothetical protein
MKISRNMMAAGAALAAVTLFATASQAATTSYFDEASFVAAAGPTVLEDFEDTTLATRLSIASDLGNLGAIGFGVVDHHFHDEVTPSFELQDVVTPPFQTTYSFAGGSTAFGGFWDESPLGFGTGLQFNINFMGGGSLLLSQQLDGFSGQFFGFVSDTRFSSVTVISGTTADASGETYNVDNVRFSSGAVPEASTWVLMLMGFGGLGAMLRRDRRRAVAA